MEQATIDRLKEYLGLHDGYTLSISVGELKELLEAKERVERLQQEVNDFENREASVCPEDVGCDEFIPILQKRVAGLEQVLRDLHGALGDCRSEHFDAADESVCGRLLPAYLAAGEVLRLAAPPVAGKKEGE